MSARQWPAGPELEAPDAFIIGMDRVVVCLAAIALAREFHRQRPPVRSLL